MYGHDFPGASYQPITDQNLQGGYPMKKAIAGSFIAAAFAVGLSAQQPPPQSQAPQSQPPMQESKDAAKTITVTGCLKAGDSADSFTLSDLKWGSDKAVGTSGSVTPTPATPPISDSSLKLIPSASTKLNDHVGHTVEVSGTIGDKAAGAAAAADPAAARPAASQTALNVRNVRMVSATCTAKE
jgi:hypothetical protein